MPENNDPFKDFANQIWGKRAEDVPVPELDLTKVTPQEIANLQMRYAFVQMLNPEAIGETHEVQILKSRTGWEILDYRNAMSASPGEMIFNHGYYIKSADGTWERMCSGTGTLILQMMKTAEDMIHLAIQQHWPSAHIVDGYRKMMWGIWKAAQDFHLPVTGFLPTPEEQAKYERIRENCQALITGPESYPAQNF